MNFTFAYSRNPPPHPRSQDNWRRVSANRRVLQSGMWSSNEQLVRTTKVQTSLNLVYNVNTYCRQLHTKLALKLKVSKSEKSFSWMGNKKSNASLTSWCQRIENHQKYDLLPINYWFGLFKLETFKGLNRIQFQIELLRSVQVRLMKANGYDRRFWITDRVGNPILSDSYCKFRTDWSS